MDSAFISVMQRRKSGAWLSIAIHRYLSWLPFLSSIYVKISIIHAKNSAVFMAMKHCTCCSQACLTLSYCDSLVWIYLFPLVYLSKSVIFIIFRKALSLFLVLSIFSYGSSVELTSLTRSVTLYIYLSFPLHLG